MEYLKLFDDLSEIPVGSSLVNPMVGVVKNYYDRAIYGDSGETIVHPDGEGWYDLVHPQEIVITMQIESANTYYTILGSAFSGFTSTDAKMYVDDSEVTFAKTYSFSTTGTHVVKYKLNDNFVLTNATKMFNAAFGVKTIDVSKLDLNSCTALHTMFQSVNANTSHITYNVVGLNNIKGGNLTSVIAMFNTTSALTSVGDISKWNVSNITNFQNFFNRCSGLTSVDLSKWDVSNATTIQYLFSECHSLTSVGNLSNWDVSKTTSLQNLFNGCSNLTNVGNLSNWNVSNVTNMLSLFSAAQVLKTVGDLSKWNVGKVTNLSYSFGNYGTNVYNGTTDAFIEGYTQADLNALMINVFDLSGWNTSAVTTIKSMFTYTEAIRKIKLSGWDVSSLTTMEDAFHYSRWLEEIDFSGWNLPSTVSYARVFEYCNRLQRVILIGATQTTIDIITQCIQDAGLTNVDIIV